MEFGLSKEHPVSYTHLERNMELMLGIKKVFDPKLILNPGKVCYKL